MSDLQLELSLPIAGRTPRSRHASRSGAVRAAKDRGALSAAYLQLLRVAGPLSDFEAAAALGRLVSSINSTRNGLNHLVVPSDQVEDTPWGTKRTKWMVRQ